MKNYLEKRLRYLSQKQNNAQNSLFRLETGVITYLLVVFAPLLRAGVDFTSFVIKYEWIFLAFTFFYTSLLMYFQHRTQEYDAMCKVTLKYLCMVEDPKKYEFELNCEEETDKMKSSSTPRGIDGILRTIINRFRQA